MPAQFVDARKFRRADVGPGYWAQFQNGKRFFFGLPLTALGAGGCCLRVSSQLAGTLTRDAHLTRLCIVHPSIPRMTLQGRVAWMQNWGPGLGTSAVLVGIEFQDAPADFVSAVDQHIGQLLA